MSFLLEARGLVRTFATGGGGWFGRRRRLVAVAGVDLEVRGGEVVAVVGESGCGKTTLGRLLLRLLEPDRGSMRVEVDGTVVDWSGLRGRRLRRFRRTMQVVFQDPDASLDPRQRVVDIVGEGLRAHRLARGRAIAERVVEVLDEVGLGPDVLELRPAALSGGQKQRVAIARALAVGPRFLVLDEAVSALDVSVQAQVLDLLERLRARRSLAYLFISHDLAVVRQIADRVIVMYLGRVVEEGPVEAVFDRPAHPYTRALLEAVPVPDPARRGRRRIVLSGEPPSGLHPPPGCPFHPRCPIAESSCAREDAPIVELGAGRWSRCAFWQRVGRPGEPIAQPVAEQAGGEDRDREGAPGEDDEPPRAV